MTKLCKISSHNCKNWLAESNAVYLGPQTGIVRRSEFFEFGGLIGLRGNTRQRRETKIGPGYATQLEKVAIISLCTFTDLFLIDTVFLTS